MSDNKEINQYETDDKAESYSKHKENLYFKYIDVPSIKKLFNNDLSGKSIIDYACGVGHSTWILASMNPQRIVGVDLSPQMIEKAKKYSSNDPNNSRIEFYVGDCSKELNLGQYDFVFSSHLLNYGFNLQILEKFAESSYKSTKSGGCCCGLMVNPSLDPQDFSLLSKYGFERIKKSDFINTVKFYDGPAIDGKYLFEVENYIWKREIHEECFRKAGFIDFEWIEQRLAEDYKDKEGFFDDYLKIQPYVLFKAYRPK